MENKRKILVIDDEESIRFTFESFLTDEGHEVTTAKDYDEAVAVIGETDFDLIFADIILGAKTGIDVMREVRRRNLNCLVIMITGDPSLETASEALRLGAFDYIPKPVRQDTLIHLTEIALKHKAINDEKEKYRSNLDAIFRSVKDAIITVDEELKIVAVNETALSICGLSRKNIGEQFSALTADCAGTCFKALSETINNKIPVEIYRLECRHGGRPGQVVTVSTSPLLDHHGTFSGAVIVVRDETRLADLERDINERQQFHKIVGASQKMQYVYSLIEDLADVQSTVLITGESGTGKELVAEALHFKGARSNKPLVKVNCSALSEGLLESELFGHVRGAFTGAVRDRTGRFEMADSGTIFLDEIGDISQRIQLHLLRVLQDMEFERVGDSTPVRVDVRVIAATNQDLSAKVRSGEFREDLYYRLKVVEITMPPLRERMEDIPLFVDHFINKFNKRLNREVSGVSSGVSKIFMDYPWPGNVRELEHTLEHAVILCRQNIITVDHLPAQFRDLKKTEKISGGDGAKNELKEILSALEKTAGNKSRAARLLGMDRKTLYRKIERYNITTKGSLN